MPVGAVNALCAFHIYFYSGFTHNPLKRKRFASVPLPSQQKHGHVISRLCLGTVQLGMDYGAANRSGMPDAAAAQALLAQAAAQGITLFDTARAYGVSEQRLGAAREFLAGATLITKCDPLAGFDEATLAQVDEAVAQSVAASCAAMGVDMLPYVLLHRAEHFQQWDGAVWKALAAHPRVRRVGVSVATPQEALAAIANPHMEAIQLPFHILDGRWGVVIAALKQRPDMLVMARSSLLQGVLTLPAAQWPLPLGQAEMLCGLLDGWVREFGREGRVDLCLAYVRAQGWIDSVVLGMETETQLAANIALFERPTLDAAACAAIEAARPLLDETFLNPALWPKKGD